MQASILIANYNYARFLRACVDSALEQVFDGEFEVIVYDDGSTDDSLSILRSYGDQIRLISAKNHGDRHAFNQLNAYTEAFKQATGEIIFLLDSDDAFEPGKLAAVHAVFAAHPDVVAVENAGVHINGEGSVTRERHRQRRWNLHEFPAGVVEPEQMLGAMRTTNSLFFGLPTSFLSFRKRYVDQLLPMPRDAFAECYIDVRLSTPVPFHGQFFVLDEPLTRYRIHADNYYQRPTLIRMLRCNIDANRYCNTWLAKHGEKPLNFWLSRDFLRLYKRFFSLGFWKRYLRRNLPRSLRSDL